MEHFLQWEALHRLTSSDFGVNHYESIMRMLDQLGCWGHSDVTNLAGVEVALRQAQFYERSYAMYMEGVPS